jgi:hypothetical protein
LPRPRDQAAVLKAQQEPGYEWTSTSVKGFATTLLTAEQNFNQAIRIDDRAYVMVQGRIDSKANPPPSSRTTR